LHFLRTQALFADAGAPFDEKHQLACRQLDTRRPCSFPKRSKPSLVQALTENAQTCPVPHQHFASASRPANENEQASLQNIGSKLRLNQSA
jgi:hypothetical protein